MKKSIVIKPLPFIFNLILSLGGGLLVGLLTNPDEKFKSLTAPPLAPPAILFPIVWSILYTLMAVSITLVISKNSIKSEDAAKVYYLQLIVNFIWPFLFFTFGFLTLSFIWLLLLIALVVVMIVRFYRVSPLAAYLQIPYLVWLLFAAYLNLGYVVLNP
ncbi:MAG: tryptophan-rich sensory protein [Ruminococcaceae bacterium]|nr:tryptophan-rich sensory protein [Oscillospiraceae bacterium]